MQVRAECKAANPRGEVIALSQTHFLLKEAAADTAASLATAAGTAADGKTRNLKTAKSHVHHSHFTLKVSWNSRL